MSCYNFQDKYRQWYRMNIHNSTKQVIPQQVQPVQYSELLFRLLPRLSVVVAAVKAV